MSTLALTSRQAAILNASLAAAEGALLLRAREGEGQERAQGDDDLIPSPEAIVRKAGRRLGLNWRDCTPDERLKLLHGVRLCAREWLRKQGEKLAETLYPEPIARAICGIKAYMNDVQVEAALYADQCRPGLISRSLFGDAKVSAERFFDRAGRFIRNSIMAGWLAVAGPESPTRVEAETLDRAAAEQQVFLRQFEQEVMQEQKLFVPARAEMYGASVWGAPQDAAMAGAKSKLFREARREHRGSDQPCNGCASWVARGWVPIEEIALIGSQVCRQNCHCVIWCRDDEDGPEYPLGRMPNVGRNIAPQNFRSLGVRFRQSDAALRARNRTLIVDVTKLNEAWARDQGFYIPPGAENVGGRRDAFRAYLEKAQREGLPIDQSQVTIDPDGTVSFSDGRHRFAVLRDRGIDRLPVSVPREDYERFKQLFGWGSREQRALGFERILSRRNKPRKPRKPGGEDHGSGGGSGGHGKFDSSKHPHQPDGKFAETPDAVKPSKPKPAGGAGAAKPKHQTSRYHTPESRSKEHEKAAADKAEIQITKAVGARWVGKNDPVFGYRNNPPYDGHFPGKGDRNEFIEVKYKHRGKKNELSVHADAELRKADAAAKHNGDFHTVLLDVRDRAHGGGEAKHYSGHDLYYRRGVGAYSTANMYRCKNEAELKRLIRMPDHELPLLAQGETPVRTPKLEAQAAKVEASRIRRDKNKKARRDKWNAKEKARKAELRVQLQAGAV